MSQRRLARGSIVGVALVGVALAGVALAGCSAVDDFSAFRFVDDGGAGGGDLATASAVGAACAGGCSDGLSCVTQDGNVGLPGGACTVACDPQQPGACPAGSACGAVDNGGLCLALCDPSSGRGCRSGYACCAGGHVVGGPGACAPPTARVCGGN